MTEPAEAEAETENALVAAPLEAEPSELKRVVTPDMIAASGYAAINAVVFTRHLFEVLSEGGIESVTEQKLRELAVECGVVVEQVLDEEEIAKMQAIDPDFVASPGDDLPSLSDDMMTFLDTMETAMSQQEAAE